MRRLVTRRHRRRAMPPLQRPLPAPRHPLAPLLSSLAYPRRFVCLPNRPPRSSTIACHRQNARRLLRQVQRFAGRRRLLTPILLLSPWQWPHVCLSLAVVAPACLVHRRPSVRRNVQCPPRARCQSSNPLCPSPSVGVSAALQALHPCVHWSLILLRLHPGHSWTPSRGLSLGLYRPRKGDVTPPPRHTVGKLPSWNPASYRHHANFRPRLLTSLTVTHTLLPSPPPLQPWSTWTRQTPLGPS